MYKCIIVTKRGPPENLQIAERNLRDPSAGEIRVQVLACCVCLPDVQARYGLRPFAPKVPFVRDTLSSALSIQPAIASLRSARAIESQPT